MTRSGLTLALLMSACGPTPSGSGERSVPPAAAPASLAEPASVCPASTPLDPVRGCAKNDPRSCYLLAVQHDMNIGPNAIDDERAVVLYQQACAAGVAAACYTVGEILEVRRGREAVEEIADAYQAACDAGEPRGCTSVGLLHENDRVNRGKLDLERAASLYAKACEQGDAFGCYRLGSFYRDGRGGVPRDGARARALYVKACASGEGAFIEDGACMDAARIVACDPSAPSCDHKGIADAKVLASLERPCVQGDHLACVARAKYIEIGRGTKPSIDAARAYYEAACKHGEPWSCDSLASLYLRGDGVVRAAPDRAAALFERACDQGFARSCRHLSAMYASGTGVAEDRGKTIDLERRACELGLEDVCIELELGCASGNVDECAQARRRE